MLQMSANHSYKKNKKTLDVTHNPDNFLTHQNCFHGRQLAVTDLHLTENSAKILKWFTFHFRWLVHCCKCALTKTGWGRKERFFSSEKKKAYCHLKNVMKNLTFLIWDKCFVLLSALP